MTSGQSAQKTENPLTVKDRGRYQREVPHLPGEDGTSTDGSMDKIVRHVDFQLLLRFNYINLSNKHGSNS